MSRRRVCLCVVRRVFIIWQFAYVIEVNGWTDKWNYVSHIIMFPRINEALHVEWRVLLLQLMFDSEVLQRMLRRGKSGKIAADIHGYIYMAIRSTHRSCWTHFSWKWCDDGHVLRQLPNRVFDWMRFNTILNRLVKFYQLTLPVYVFRLRRLTFIFYRRRPAQKPENDPHRPDHQYHHTAADQPNHCVCVAEMDIFTFDLLKPIRLKKVLWLFIESIANPRPVCR